MESGERLKAENERLVAEMASMKKKIKLALKKQQAELQARIQAAEGRAAAAEAAAGALNGSVSKTNSQIAAIGSAVSERNGAIDASSPVNSLASEGGSPRHRESLSGSEVSNGEITHSPDSEVSSHKDARGADQDAQAALERLRAELRAEIEEKRRREEVAARERQLLENEIIELKQKNESVVKQKNEAIAEADEELRLAKQDAQQRVEHLTKANEKLETQLMAAAEQVAEAFTRMSTTHDDMERISKEGHEMSRAHLDLVAQHSSTCKELEQANVSLAETQKHLQEKIKEMEEIAASRKAAQEGQEAAMSQLMHRLDEMEAAGTGQEAEQKWELTEDKVQLLLQEKAILQKELEESSKKVVSLKEQVRALQQHFLSDESSFQKVEDPNNGSVQMKESSDLVNLNDVDISLHSEMSELKAQNKSLMAQLEDFKSQAAAADRLHYEVVELEAGSQQLPEAATLQELLTLKEHLRESRECQQAAEDQVKHLSTACAEAQQRVDALSHELAEALRKLEIETKQRDEKYAELDVKYAELDAKFGRLQKRAKQRIQEVQKEKEEVEAQLGAAGEKAAQALSKQAVLQDELERTRHQSGEALRSLGAERQQLRVANTKLKEEVEDLRHSLEAKEHNLAESRRLASEKDQMALEMAALLKEAEGNHETAVLNLKEKHKKAIEDLNLHLADGGTENNKMAETISALQTQLAAKESKLAELEAASSGEVVRLGASIDTAKGELSRLEQEQKKEREAWQASLEKLKRKLEDSEKSHHQQEVAFGEIINRLESELERKRQSLSSVQADLDAANDKAARIANDLASYKVRAYALLQKKEAELLAAKDVELAAAQEKALKEATREAAAAEVARDTARKALQEAISDYETKLAARGVALLDGEQRIKDLVIKLEATKGQIASEQYEWQHRLEQVEATWRLRYEAMETKVKDTVKADLRREYTTLLSDYENVKGEFESFREMVDRMIEEKDQEISRLLEDNASLQRSSQQPKMIQSKEPSQPASLEKAEPAASMVALEDHQILLLARQQAQREEEVSQCRRHIKVLQEEVAELEQENQLHSQQEALLKEEVRKLERAHKRDGVDMTYLKNVILKLLETGEVEALLPVIAMLLQFSPEELKRCHDTYSNAGASERPLSIPGAVVEPVPSSPSSFFSRLNFSSGR